jgi:hypothetical protein
MTHVLQFEMVDGRKVIFFGMLIAFISSFLLYIYLLNSTIVQVVERKTAEAAISDTTMHISELESDYLRLSSAITPTLAQTLGFIEPKGVTFASRDTHSGFASLPE